MSMSELKGESRFKFCLPDAPIGGEVGAQGLRFRFKVICHIFGKGNC